MWEDKVAERVGFEPTVQLPVLRFSRPALSSTQPSLRTNHSMIFRFLCQRMTGKLPSICTARYLGGCLGRRNQDILAIDFEIRRRDGLSA